MIIKNLEILFVYVYLCMFFKKNLNNFLIDVLGYYFYENIFLAKIIENSSVNHFKLLNNLKFYMYFVKKLKIFFMIV